VGRGCRAVQCLVPPAGPAELRFCDELGRQVIQLRQGFGEAGRHGAVWEGLDSRGQPVGSGVYFAQLRAVAQVFTRKVVLVR